MRTTPITTPTLINLLLLLLYCYRCFIPSASVAGVSTALPIIISLLIAIGMLSHSCIYWTRWEDIKSLYKDTYNKRGQ